MLAVQMDTVAQLLIYIYIQSPPSFDFPITFVSLSERHSESADGQIRVSVCWHGLCLTKGHITGISVSM